ncbi:hypothetical protein EK904_004931 [Melospiza melodia maxima]|nr:hypothetical protein EK904_004931 [Melospiza melodia maxima]
MLCYLNLCLSSAEGPARPREGLSSKSLNPEELLTLEMMEGAELLYIGELGGGRKCAVLFGKASPAGSCSNFVTRVCSGTKKLRKMGNSLRIYLIRLLNLSAGAPLALSGRILSSCKSLKPGKCWGILFPQPRAGIPAALSKQAELDKNSPSCSHRFWLCFLGRRGSWELCWDPSLFLTNKSKNQFVPLQLCPSVCVFRVLFASTWCGFVPIFILLSSGGRVQAKIIQNNLENTDLLWKPSTTLGGLRVPRK